MNEIFLDTETTGLSYKDNHKIVEIACVETIDLVPTKKIFHKHINPKRSVPDEAYRVHGFSTEFLNEKETFDKVADEFIEFIKGKKLIIHNAPFDIGFLNYELRLLKKDEIKMELVIDTLDIARSKFPGTSNSLDALCKRFGIDLSRRSKHNALLDCELLREVYINLFDAREPRLAFSNQNKENNTSSISKQILDYSKKIVKISDIETAEHKNFLQKSLKKNYY
jgi:DNA polymerase-3 subunit epsilon|tara:strand:- start:466 stop:1137 length:672 start_codon:yes stop_codon:yes gene_type:complete